MKRLILLITILLLPACVVGPSRQEIESEARLSEFKRKLDDIPWKGFLTRGGIDDCARIVAFNRSTYDPYCEKYKDRPETQAKIQQVKDEFVKLNPSPSISEVIKTGKIMTGMSKDEVRMSWGRPYSINRTVTSSSAHEQWVYGDEYNKKTYLYFDNNVLTAWQD